MTPELPCGCNGEHECPEAVRLWREVNRQYDICSNKPTAFPRWEAYDKALATYRQHKEEMTNDTK